MTIQEQIKQVWAVEQEILDVIDRVCSEHHLRYTLAYGTLIGAVRHGGFIPWDDDIDLIMPREDYDKLLSVWNDAVSGDYILQHIHITPDYTHTFTKIRKNHTTFLQDEAEAGMRYHKGVFVDIFPADRVAQGRLARLTQYVACAVNLLYTREYTSGTGGIIGLTERTLLAFPRRLHPILRNAAEKYIQKWNGRNELRWFAPSTIISARRYYPVDSFENMGSISFCGKTYSCVADTDTFLRVDYGDYMQLPPEEDRVWKHHPVIIDLEHNYEEIKRS